MKQHLPKLIAMLLGAIALNAVVTWACHLFAPPGAWWSVEPTEFKEEPLEVSRLGHTYQFEHAGGGKAVRLLVGFPFRSLAIRKQGWPSDPARPAGPVWLGFVANVLLFAVSFVIVGKLASHLRRTRRKRLGLCPICAYTLGDSLTCPECGTRAASVDRPPTVS